MLSDGMIVLCWVLITLTLIQIGQLSSFSIFPKARSGPRYRGYLEAAGNEIDKPANFIEEKNMEQSMFNPPPRSKKMMNQRGIISDVEDVIVNMPLGRW